MDGARCRPTRGGEFIRSASKSLTPFSRKLPAIQSIGVIFALELFFFLNTLVGFVASLAIKFLNFVSSGTCSSVRKIDDREKERWMK